MHSGLEGHAFWHTSTQDHQAVGPHTIKLHQVLTGRRLLDVGAKDSIAGAHTTSALLGEAVHTAQARSGTRDPRVGVLRAAQVKQSSRARRVSGSES